MMSFSDGRKRTSLRFLLASLIALARLTGLRYLSSLIVSTPTAFNRQEYSFPIPLIRMRSAAFAHPRMRALSKPVLAASRLRPFGVLAASSSRSVVRIPNDFSFLSSSASRPSIWLMGYGITFSSLPCRWPAPSGASIEHAKARERACDLFDRIVRGFLTGIDDCYGGAGAGIVGRSSRDAFRDIEAVEGADRRVHRGVSSVCPVFSAQVSLGNSNGCSRNRLLGAFAGDEIFDPLTHLPLVSPTLAAGLI